MPDTRPTRASTALRNRLSSDRASHLARTLPDSQCDLAAIHNIWRALYKTYHSAHAEFPDVDWISLLVILDVIAVARANRRQVDISYLSAELGWPRTTTLRRLRVFVRAGYLTLTRHGRHTYIDHTPKAWRRALKVIGVLIENVRCHPSEQTSEIW